MVAMRMATVAGVCSTRFSTITVGCIGQRSAKTVAKFIRCFSRVCLCKGDHLQPDVPQQCRITFGWLRPRRSLGQLSQKKKLPWNVEMRYSTL